MGSVREHRHARVSARKATCFGHEADSRHHRDDHYGGFTERYDGPQRLVLIVCLGEPPTSRTHFTRRNRVQSPGRGIHRLPPILTRRAVREPPPA
jgi:hypothetical protein